MASVNKAIIVGRIGNAPEVRYMPNGEAVVNLSVATTETWRDKQTGEKKEATEWHRVTVYRKLAEVIGQYIEKGSLVYFEGKLQTKKYKDKDGIERSTTEIVADSMQMLGSKGSGDNSAPRQSAPAPKQQTGGQKFTDMDDDIPFMNPYHGKHYLIV